MQASDHCHSPARFTPGERIALTHWTGGWLDVGTGLDVPPAGIRTPDRPTPDLVYTDVIPAPFHAGFST
jgi:hypothetical protein